MLSWHELQLVCQTIGWTLFVLLILAYPALCGFVYINDEKLNNQAAKAAREAKDNELEAASSRSEGGEPRVAGYITVRSRFAPLSSSKWFGTSTKLTPADAFVLEETSSDIAQIAGPSAEPLSQSASMAKAYRGMVNQQAKEKPASRNDIYWGELNGRVLSLYDGPKKEKRIVEINICDRVVGMWTKRGKFDGRDSQMFNKKNMIALRPDTSSQATTAKVDQLEGTQENDEEGCVYVGCKTSPLMEDWYLAFLEVSANSASAGDIFSEGNMQELIEKIRTEPDELNGRWLNVFLGRVFFGLYRTRWLENLLLRKLRTKLGKTELGTYVSNPEVHAFHVGSAAPWFGKPMLKNAQSDGSVSMHVHGRYEPTRPEDRLYISASAVVTLPTLIPSRPVISKIGFTVYLSKLEGDLEIKIKAPPSNRLWYGFTSPPILDLAYEFSGSTMNFLANLGPAKSAIDSAIKTLIAGAIVLPNMDDVSFFDTINEVIRGGIFDSLGKVLVEMPQAPVTGTLGLPATTTISDEAKFRLGLLSRDRKSKTLAPGVAEVIEQSEAIKRTESAPADIDQAPKKWYRSRSKSPKSDHQALPSNMTKGEDGKATTNLQPAPLDESSDDKPTRKDSDESLPKSLKKTLTGLARKSSPPSTVKRNGNTSPQSEDSSLPAVPEPSSIRSGAASFISEIRGRDRTVPVRDQVSSVLDLGKKSWAGLRARRGERANQPVERPTPVYRPADQDHVVADSHRRSMSMTQSGALQLDLNRNASLPPISLQDRLSAAARAAAVDVPAGRDRASSNSSNRLSLSSPPTNPALGSTPPKGWTLPTSGPTTNVARPEVVPPKLDSGRPVPPPPAPVSRQPAAGKSMVVPRVPKRPGQVVGIGSSEGPEGLIRRVSSSEGTGTVVVDQPIEDKPSVPPRKPKKADSILPLYTPPSPPPQQVALPQGNAKRETAPEMIPLPVTPPADTGRTQFIAGTPPAAGKVSPPNSPFEKLRPAPVTPPRADVKKAQLADTGGEEEPFTAPATNQSRRSTRDEMV